VPTARMVLPYEAETELLLSPLRLIVIHSSIVRDILAGSVLPVPSK